MLRQALLLLARSHQVKEIVTRMPVSSGIVNRYVPGEGTDDAVTATHDLIDDGLHVTLDFLGEDTLDEAQAEHTVQAYLELLEGAQPGRPGPQRRGQREALRDRPGAARRSGPSWRPRTPGGSAVRPATRARR